jgi:hypothetical protein
MQQIQIGSDLAAQVVIPYFLRTLMKIERERLGLSRQAASRKARWSMSAWGHFERGTRNIQPHHWINISSVLGLSDEDEVRRMNAFVGKHPGIWLERLKTGEIRVCERALTSPRPMRSGNVFSYDLNPIRPNLYYELSTYSQDPESVVALATELGMFKSREIRTSDLPPPAISPAERTQARREKICQIVTTAIADEKLGLLERMLDKFQRYKPDELAHAYKHFSLAVSREK